MTPVPRAALLGLAQQFVSRVSKGFEEADTQMGTVIAERKKAILLPDGEVLMLNIALPRKLVLDNLVMAEVQNKRVVLSLHDYLTALDFPIEIDADAGVVSGWYIRENKKFFLDMKSRTVQAEDRSYRLSDAVTSKDDDIFVPADEVALWFGLPSVTDIGQQQIKITPVTPLPVQERLARGERKLSDRINAKPELPLLKEKSVMLAAPFVDVSSTSAYAKDGKSGETQKSYNSNVTTRGDFANGTLTTQTQLNNVDHVTSVRANYKKESLDPELLGALKARSYEIGDIVPPALPLQSGTKLGSGVHVTNRDPTQSFINPSTGVTGYAPAGWEIELYRDNQLLDYQRVGDDGVYQFQNIDLFSSNNNFRVVSYGPQGEIQEERLDIAVDPRRRSNSGNTYDLALTADGRQLYSKAEAQENSDAPRFVGLYEAPINNATILQLGLESGKRDDDDLTTAHAGISTALGGAILNFNAATDQYGEAGGEFVYRRDIGKHQVRNEIALATERFNMIDDGDREVFGESFQLNGPLAIPLGRSPSYNLGLDYEQTASGLSTTSADTGFSGNIGRISYSQSFDYIVASDDTEPTLSSRTSLNGSIDRTRIRLNADYSIKPQNLLNEVSLSAQRAVSKDVDLTFDIAHTPKDNLTDGRLQANWESGHGTLSPSISYNSEGDAAIMLNTRFGATRNPQNGQIKILDRQITSSGGLSAFVFLDENGDGVHQENEQPIPDARVIALQNGGARATDKDGYALFTNLQRFKQTDVILDASSLSDPFWLPGRQGSSILPREGHMSQITFPVVKAGEIDGTVLIRNQDETTLSVRNVSLGLYNSAGKKIMSAQSEDDGYYLFSPVPPGNYFLVVDQKSTLKNEQMRPAPAPIKIGYEGTTISGNNIYMEPGSDAPLRILADMKDIAADDPALDPKKLSAETIVLNLGSFNSRVLMGFTLYKARTFGQQAVDGLDTLVPPSDSYAATKTGKHTLRVGAPSLTLQEGSRRCGLLNAAGIKCTVEVLPGGLQLAKL